MGPRACRGGGRGGVCAFSVCAEYGEGFFRRSRAGESVAGKPIPSTCGHGVACAVVWSFVGRSSLVLGLAFLALGCHPAVGRCVAGPAPNGPNVVVMTKEDGTRVYRIDGEIVIEGKIEKPQIKWILPRAEVGFTRLPESIEAMANDAKKASGADEELSRVKIRLTTKLPEAERQSLKRKAEELYLAVIRNDLVVLDAAWLSFEEGKALGSAEERSRRSSAVPLFEAFLRKYPADKKWTPDVMFRLAELYYEKSSDEFLTAQENYRKALDMPTPPTTPPPKADYNPTVTLYRKLLVEFPNYRLLDATYYLLGFCLGEMGQDPEARQALLALTCANQYKPVDPPAEHKPSTGMSRGLLADYYKDCTPIKKDSKFLPEAWTRVGEMHFDAAELAWAISAYSRVLAWTESAYYEKAIYKLAWSYYLDNRFIEAIREFDSLVKWADRKKSAGDKFGSDLRPEVVQYLGICFSEPDWDGDTLPDPETGLQRAQAFYRGREREPHVKEVFQRLGDIYFDGTKFTDAIAVYRAILAVWPDCQCAAHAQERIIEAYEKDRNPSEAAKERAVLARMRLRLDPNKRQ
jgi:tetratricopeptide (TPR) repeat protein